MITSVSASQPIDIVMVSWYRPKITELAIRTIRRNTKRGGYRLIVLDNGSPKSQREMLTQLWDNGYIDELELISENIGLEPARNRGLSLVKSSYFVCADNDCLPEPMADGMDWLDKLYVLMEKYEDYAAIAARTQVMIGTGNIFDGVTEDIVDFPHPGGSLRIMQTDAVKQVGGWRDVPGRGAEERHICGKLREAGYKTAFATKVNCLHLFGDKSTDRWGYPKTWKPDQTGHSDIWHPILESGDDLSEVRQYAGETLVRRYYA